MPKPKIDVLLPDRSTYDVLHHFCKKIFESLQRAGYSCRLLGGTDRYTESLRSPPDYTLGFNGALKIDDGKFFCEHINVPHIACLVDPPYRFMNLGTSPLITATSDDEYCAAHFSHIIKNLTFMPQAVERELAMANDEEKIYDIVMLATYIDCERRKSEWKQMFPENVYQGMLKAVDITLNDETTSFITALEHFLNININETVDWAMYEKMCSEVELYLKGRDKLDLLDHIDTEVHIFGTSIDRMTWKEAYKDRPNIIVHPEVPFLEALEIMKRTKILLNSNIKNKHGAHERVFSGLAAGAIVATNDNPYMQSCFTSDEILLYRRSAYQALNERIHDLLKHEPRRREMSALAKAKVLANHTWDERIKSLEVKFPA